ncbi:MAG: FAD-dependent monooxygenase [Micrococcales bacterium]|nr:FAD-dependent monooxygenase [Micrococcales bacterium]
MGTPHRQTSLERTADVDVDVDVLVVGAGPTGLVAAAEALRQGLSVRIVDRKATRGTVSKALVVHARTLEVFDTMGIAQEIRALGAPFAALNMTFADGRRQVRVDLLDLPWGDTAYPYWLSVPQYDTERVLEAHLGSLHGAVEWSSRLRELRDRGACLEAVLERASGAETVRARWVIGCDGGRSTVRDQCGINLARTGAGTTFLLADAKSTSDLVEDEGYLHLASQGLLLIVPMPEPGRWRLIAHVPTPELGTDGDVPVIDAAGLDEIIRARCGIEFGSHDVSWTSQFDLTHGVADRFRAGRVFLAGDAAHIHSPVGGQGLNTGVQDAHNVIWKIAQARHLSPQRAEDLLNSYESERRGTAVPMVRGVARTTTILTCRRWLVRRVVGWLAPRALRRPRIQARLGRGVGMLNLSYAGKSRRAGTLTNGLKMGRRMPNPELSDKGRLFDRMHSIGYHWVVLADSDAPIPDPSAAHWRGVPVVFLKRTDIRDPKGYPRHSKVVLVRPDGYIAAVGAGPESLADAVLPTAFSVADARTADRVGRV